MTEISIPQDPALAAAVLEIENHIAEAGWDQPARLYALVDTSRIVAQEPDLAAAMGLDSASADGSFTPVEQDALPPEQALEVTLESIVWPGDVAGCAAVVERLVLPPEVDPEIPADPADAERFAREHPLRQEVRIVGGRHPRRRHLLRAAPARPRRRPVGGRRDRARARPPRPPPQHPRGRHPVSGMFDQPDKSEQQEPPQRSSRSRAAGHHRGRARRGVHRPDRLLVLLDRAAVVRLGRLLRGLQHPAVDPGGPLPGLRWR